jgi:hypothetical protein
MTRLSREQLFTPDEIAIVHVMNRAVRRCFLMGYDQFTGRNYDYRKDWIEHHIEHQNSSKLKFFQLISAKNENPVRYVNRLFSS